MSLVARGGESIVVVCDSSFGWYHSCGLNIIRGENSASVLLFLCANYLDLTLDEPSEQCIHSMV